MSQPNLSVILPTYNERQFIGQLVSKINQAVKPLPEIIIVDDDSPDETWQVIMDLQRKIPNLKLYRRRSKRSLAASIAEGIAHSSGNNLTWMDCDFSHPPSLIPEMLHKLKYFDLVIASRYVKGGGQKAPLMRVITSRIFNMYANLLLGIYVKDWTSGFIAIRRDALHKIKIRPIGQGYGEYFISLLFQAGKLGLKVKEVPYIYIYNHKHQTKTSPNIWKLLTFGWTYGLSVLELKLKSFRGKV